MNPLAFLSSSAESISNQFSSFSSWFFAPPESDRSLSPLSFLLPFFLFPLLLLFVSYHIGFRQYLQHRRVRLSGIPGPTFVPILGDIPEVSRAYSSCRFLDFMEEQFNFYGPIFSSTRGLSCPRIHLNDPEYFSFVFKAESLGC